MVGLGEASLRNYQILAGQCNNLMRSADERAAQRFLQAVSSHCSSCKGVVACQGAPM